MRDKKRRQRSAQAVGDPRDVPGSLRESMLLARLVLRFFSKYRRDSSSVGTYGAAATGSSGEHTVTRVAC